jgi:gliding motility-associated-like protein
VVSKSYKNPSIQNKVSVKLPVGIKQIGDSTAVSIIAVLEYLPAVLIPDGFSPDGDGVNDNFVIPDADKYPENTLSIFNRWGDKVYEEYRYNNTWSGVPNVGLLITQGILPAGTYFYIFNTGMAGEKPIVGSLFINR